MRHGFLLIDKPIGPTSHDVVAMTRRKLHERDIGHLGTLDPGASGLLVLAVGAKALKVLELFKDMSKEYRATIFLGAVSSTYDHDGHIEQVTLKPGRSIPDLVEIRRSIDEKFSGKIKQVPPAHSAVHIDGKRAYELAREGKDVIMPERTVEISSCTIVSYEYPHLVLDVACGSGTYIRSLAHDLGGALSCGGYLSALRRTNVGDWSVDNAVSIEDATWTDVLPLKDVLAGHPSIELTTEEFEDIRHGRSIKRELTDEAIAWHEGLPVAIVIPIEEHLVRPRKVF